MKWFYKWKLSRIHAEIDALKEATASSLCDSYYTDNSRLRNLNRMAGRLQERIEEPKRLPSDRMAPPLS